MGRTKVIDCARAVLSYMGKNVDLTFDPSKPTVPYNRVCDLRRCRVTLDWEPKVKFLDELHSAVDWYVNHHDVDRLRGLIKHLLLERQNVP